MVGSAATAVRCPCIVDAERRGTKVDSASGTDAFGPWRSCAARRGQVAVVVVESAIYPTRSATQSMHAVSACTSAG
ncbi:MAG: hypothetical protein QOJ35_521, partial [Solirubrobacteraceae bacterium]|nr:hypothetical protein [Solirubrobacteraceae bacterium]